MGRRLTDGRTEVEQTNLPGVSRPDNDPSEDDDNSQSINRKRRDKRRHKVRKKKININETDDDDMVHQSGADSDDEGLLNSKVSGVSDVNTIRQNISQFEDDDDSQSISRKRREKRRRNIRKNKKRKNDMDDDETAQPSGGDSDNESLVNSKVSGAGDVNTKRLNISHPTDIIFIAKNEFDIDSKIDTVYMRRILGDRAERMTNDEIARVVRDTEFLKRKVAKYMKMWVERRFVEIAEDDANIGDCSFRGLQALWGDLKF